MATITSTSANETLKGSTVNDTYVFNNGFGNDVILDGGGLDLLNFSSVTSAITVNLNASSTANEVVNGTNRVNWTGNIIENVITGSGNDYITGNSYKNVLYGNSGNDTLIGGGGNDTLNGGSGNDYYGYANGWGQDIISDSSGSDTVYLQSVTSNLLINMDNYLGFDVTDGYNGIDWATGSIERVVSGSGHDTINGNSANNYIDGGNGNDSIDGGYGNDTLLGGNGNDVLVDTDGSDILYGGAGNDVYGFTMGIATGLNDVIQDASGTGDIIDATMYMKGFFSWSAQDSASDADNFVDKLVISSWLQTITINNYFSNTSVDDDLSSSGSGLIERMMFGDDLYVDFSDVQHMIA